MWSILVADDESIERQGIKSLLRQLRVQFEVHEAPDGVRALSILAETQVDILFTDIKMPFVDGLELSREARRLYPELKIVLYSAFDEFTYAQEAIDIGVVKYVLKPIDVDEFNHTMAVVMNLCTQANKEKADRQRLSAAYSSALEGKAQTAVLQLLHGVEIDDQHAESARDFLASKFPLRMMGISSTGSLLRLHLEEIRRLLAQELVIETLPVAVTRSYEVLLLCHDTAIDLRDLTLFRRIVASLERMSRQSCLVVLGGRLCSVQAIRSEHHKMVHVVENTFVYSDEKVVDLRHNAWTVRQSSYSVVRELLASTEQHLEMRDTTGVLSLLEQVFLHLRRTSNMPEDYSKYVGREIARAVFRRKMNNAGAGLDDTLDRISTAPTMGALHRVVASSIEGAPDERPSATSASERAPTSHMKRFIEREYMHDIGLESLAQRFCLSPTYFSWLFRQSTGESPMRYLRKVRIAKAKEYLRRTYLKVSDIGRKVGFPNSSYFGSVFKGEVGVAPAKYRALSRREE